MIKHAQNTYTSTLKTTAGSTGVTLSEAAMSLLDRVLVADPVMRASAKVALNSKYFILAPQAPRDPLDLEPLALSPGVSMHEFETKQRRNGKEAAAATATAAAAGTIFAGATGGGGGGGDASSINSNSKNSASNQQQDAVTLLTSTT